MSEKKPTIKQVLADEQLLRQIAGGVLKPGPVDHKAQCGSRQCSKCGRIILDRDGTANSLFLEDCTIPDSDLRPMEVIADRLTRELIAIHSYQWYKAFLDTLRKLVDADGDTVMVWLVATPEQQAACALVALGLVDGGRDDE